MDIKQEQGKGHERKGLSFDELCVALRGATEELFGPADIRGNDRFSSSLFKNLENVHGSANACYVDRQD